MAKISDDLREFADAEVLNAIQISDLKHMAKRIDAEMVELPCDKDGVPINPGDEVCLNGKNGHVTRIDYHIGKDRDVIFWSGRECIVCTETELAELTHAQHDSWERIVDDIETFGNEADINDTAVEFLCKIQERIYMLAQKEDKQCQ